MKLKKLELSNFRILGDISFEAGECATVIVGPNASGKTTILEAIRFLKVLIAPRQGEDFQLVAQSLSATSGSGLATRALLGDPTKEGHVKMTITLEDSELDWIADGVRDIAYARFQRQLGVTNIQGQSVVTQHLSSPEGIEELRKVTATVQGSVDALRGAGGVIQPQLIIGMDGIHGGDLFSQECLAFLSRRLPYSEALVSYFPADRAMTGGQVNLQLGKGEVQAHMRSHLSQPHQKYARLKQYVVSQRLLLGHDIIGDFNEIFDELLPGKELGNFLIAENGQLTIEIREPATQRTYDIDQMSSGEKGIVLTFLLMIRAVATGGLILLDEPELHLNPAICRKLLPYLVEKILRPRHMQAIVCTHSPEILAEAYHRSDTELLHLRSPRDLSPIRRKDKDEVFEAFQRLGVDPAATLFNAGVLFVEGPDDVMLIELGFQEHIGGYKLQRLGGRSELEKNAKKLKKAEKEGQLLVPQGFLLDNDRRPVDILSTDMVRVIQLERYCIENYLLDDDIVFDIVKDHLGNYLGRDSPSRGEVKAKIRALAMNQFPYEIAKLVYREPENPGFRPSEIRPLAGQYGEIGKILATRLSQIHVEIGEVDVHSYQGVFVRECERLEGERRPDWQERWIVLADGKLILKGLRNDFNLQMSENDLKRRLMVESARKKGAHWVELRSFVTRATGSQEESQS